MAKTKREIPKQELDLRSVFDSIDDAVVVIDSDMVIVEANPALIISFGVSRDEIIGQPISNFFPSDVGALRLPIYKKVFVEKKLAEFESQRDGIWFQTKITPLFDVNGDVSHVSIVARDVTENRNAATKLRESEAQFRNYFELGLVGMTVSSVHRNWLHVNNRLCEILGYSWRELTTIDWISITHPDDVERDRDDFDRIVDGEIDSYVKEKRYIRKDGEIVYVKISARRVNNIDGEVDHVLALMDDVTEQKKAEEKLANSNIDLVSNVSAYGTD